MPINSCDNATHAPKLKKKLIIKKNTYPSTLPIKLSAYLPAAIIIII